MTKKPESRLQRRIREELEQTCGGFWFKVYRGPFQGAGIPDLVGCVKGYFFAFEVKRAGEKPSAIQVKTIDWINEAGGTAAVIEDASQAIFIVQDTLTRARSRS